MAEMREVDADLMLAAGARMKAQQREWKIEDGGWHGRARHSVRAVAGLHRSGGQRTARPTIAIEPALNEKFRLCGRAVGPDAVLDEDAAEFILAERRVNGSRLRRDVAVDNGVIFLLDGAALQNFSQLAGDFGIFGDDDDAAGFAVETVDRNAAEQP